MKKPPVVFSVLWLLAWPTLAGVDCGSNCRRECQQSIRVPDPRVGDPFRTRRERIRDPKCEAACEAWKGSHCNDRIQPPVPIPPPPVPPKIPDLYESVCASEFERVVRSITGRCGPNPPGHRDQVARAALRVLVDLGIVARYELDGVVIRWCDLPGDTGGMVPDRNLIYLDHSYDPSSRYYDSKNRGFVGLGALLTHELEHVRQHRGMGTDAFKCEYAEKFKRCLGCQDRSHSLERKPYDRQAYAWRVLNQELRQTFCGPFDLDQTCQLPPGSHRSGEPCSCWFNGQRYNGLVGW